jgi:hypothetical protein
MYYHVVVDDKDPKEGIQELRYIDPRKIRKVREIKKGKDPKTGAMIIVSIAEYYVYSDRGTASQTYCISQFKVFELHQIQSSMSTLV